jgi:hypothetical protein
MNPYYADERYAERAARRLCQDVLITGTVG